jgi:glycosyltransferase involved in cell wall biosynthesis
MSVHKIAALYPIFLKSAGVGYACHSILDSFEKNGRLVTLHCVAADRSSRRQYSRLAFPPWANSIGFRLFSDEHLTKFVQWRYALSLRDGMVSYIWPGVSTQIFEQARSAGCIVVTENINTHQAASKAILDSEYRRLGLIPHHGIDEERVAEEDAKLKLVDFVFSPSVEVTTSLISANVPLEKIIPASYGLSPRDIIEPSAAGTSPKKNGELTAIFVGRIGIRKGAHLLLEYWEKAKILGTLKLIGNIESDARHLIEPYLNQPGIQHIGFCNDLKPHYRDADVFIFPSLEEGSPLVTYLSLGAGLPSLVSPMGGGGIIRDGIDGMVIDPHDAAGWVGAIRLLAGDHGLRETLGANARANAEDYLWEKVGLQRLDELMNRIERRSGTPL